MNRLHFKAFTLFFLIAIILVSGCIGGGSKTEVSGSGLSIISFKSLPQVDSAEEFNIDLVVQNTGGKIAGNIQADLFQNANFEILNEQVQSISELLPSDVEIRAMGEEFMPSWLLRAPTVSETHTKSIAARVTYDYSSSATSNIYLVPKQEYDEKGAAAFPTYSTSSAGPITLSIMPMPAFRVKEGETSKGVMLNLIIKNTGSGRAVNNAVNNFRLILREGSNVLDFAQYCPDALTNEIRLYGREQSRSIRCEFPLAFDGTAVSYIVESEIQYTYYIDTQPLAIRIRK